MEVTFINDNKAVFDIEDFKNNNIIIRDYGEIKGLLPVIKGYV